MTVRQAFLKFIYPVWMLIAKFKKRTPQININSRLIPAIRSFYDLDAVLNSGAQYLFSQLKNKKVLLVNTASDCGFTNQYEELEKLSVRFSNRLVILAFPSNDFKEQEKGSDEEIAEFCNQHFNISFPLMKKSSVKKSPHQNKVYQWLTSAAKNGWNNQSPQWNFSKYLVNEKGLLTHYFDASISPLSEEVVNAILL